MTDRLSPEREAEITARAAHLYEYAQQTGEGDTLAGEDVPALLAELAAVRAERDQAQARVAELERDERVETVRALCDAADHAGITSGGWFTVEAVRKAITAKRGGEHFGSCHVNAAGHRLVNDHCLYCSKTVEEAS